MDTSTPGLVKYELAPVPADIRTCFVQVTGFPTSGTLTQKQVADLITKLRSSEVQKTACGRRLLALYNTQAQAQAQGVQ